MSSYIPHTLAGVRDLLLIPMLSNGRALYYSLMIRDFSGIITKFADE